MFDDTLKDQLTKRLGREPLENELINADNDSDLVNEVLWRLVCNAFNRLAALEKKNKIIPTPNMEPTNT